MQRYSLKKIFRCFLLIISLCALSLKSMAFITQVYTSAYVDPSKNINDFTKHASQIQILSPAGYRVNADGLISISGFLDPRLLDIAKMHRAAIMPLLCNSGEHARAHKMLNNPVAQQRTIMSVLELCKRNHYSGIQIDFEGMFLSDRGAFTHFYQKLAWALHRNHLKIAIAIIPTYAESAPTHYLQKKGILWTGVYDYKALGNSSDFVTLMAYDEHETGTPPGPIGGASWDENIIQYALKNIPARKIFLGIPWYSGYWHMSNQTKINQSTRIVEESLTHREVLSLLAQRNVALNWDNQDKVHYAFYNHHSLYEYIFAEDASSFSAKLALAKKYNLSGISNWCLCQEDQDVWQLLPRR
jgi:spore germination protein YaaH